MQSMLPTLTMDGFVQNKKVIMYKLFEYFLTSEYSQSNTFYDQVVSFKWLLATKQVDIDLARGVEDALRKLYSKYFDHVLVEARVSPVNGSESMYKIQIEVICNDDEEKYYLSNEIQYSNGQIYKYYQLLDELYDSYATDV